MITLNLSCSRLTSSHSPTLDSRFHNIVRHSGKKLDHFVIKVNSITDSTFIKTQDITGFVSINAIIDEQGNVESTFIRNKISSKIDSMAINAVENSKFKKLSNYNKRIIKYFIDITYIFYNGNVLTPLVNGRSVRSLSKEKPPINKPTNKNEFFEESERPVIKRFVKATLSSRAIRAGAQGRVTVIVDIGETGKIEKVEIEEADHELLILPTLDAASLLEFRPAKQRGKFVRVKMEIPYDYRIRK